jgi:methyl-accepting chemotaxis protein
MRSSQPSFGSSGRNDDSGFFAHHGLWAPAVRLFRRLSFGPKMLVIVAVLAVPIAVLLAELVISGRTELEFTAREREGTQHLQAFAPLAEDLIKTRNATRAISGGFAAEKDYQQSRDQSDKAFGDFDTVLKSHGDSLSLRADVDKLKSAWAATAQAKSGLDATGKSTVFAPVTEAAVEVMQKVMDNAGISLDPDLDSFYLGMAMGQTLPQLLEDLGQLRGWTTYVLVKGDSVAQAERMQTQRRYAVWDANVRRGIAELRNSLRRVATVNPQAASAVDLAALDGLETFRQRAYKIMYDGQEADAAEVWKGGGEVFGRLEGEWTKGLAVLDVVLERREATINRRLALSVSIVALGLLMAAYFCRGFFLVMRGGLQEVDRHLVAIANGDLTTSPRPWGKDEAAQLMLTMARMQTSLRGIVQSVRKSSDAIGTASSEMASAASDLSTRSETAAAALQHTASSMEQISGTVKATAEHALRANSIASTNSGVAREGGAAIDRAVGTMHSINEASRRIGDIVGTIDAIAFQTNILALNAAVEAARAGEQGRGFAVVAAEVRALAQRSATSAREIKSLIGASIEKVESGVEVVHGAGKTMATIVEMAAELNTLIDEIARAAVEQRSGVEQVGHAVQELDRMTQQNSALVEHSASAAATLHEQAAALSQEVARFVLPATAPLQS